jgi:hypothetical protein
MMNEEVLKDYLSPSHLPLLSIHPNAGLKYRAKGLSTKISKINTRQEM